MNARISVEVLRDSVTPEVDVSPVLKGIELINLITNDALELVSNSHELFLSEEGAFIKPHEISWPSLEHSINLVLTSRPLVVGDNPFVSGSSHRTLKPGSGNAIITTIGPIADEPYFTTAHEIGHILNLRYEEGGAHCFDTSCIMSEASEHIREQAQCERRGFKAVLEWAGYLPPVFETVYETKTRSFCQSCTEQLARKAFFLLRHRSGQYVPKEWL